MRELADLLTISRQAVLKRIMTGKIKAAKAGRIFLISKESIPEILGDTLTHKKKEEIENSVRKTVKEYKTALELLGKE